MKKILSCACVLALAMAAGPGWAQEGDEAPPSTVTLENQTQRLSYSIGHQVGRSLEELPEIHFETFVEAIRDVLEGRASAMTEQEVQQEIMAMSQQLRERAEREAQERDATNVDWLEENAQREGVQVTDSGLQYEVIEQGDGASPSASDMVTVHYTGTLQDGSVFDSSHRRGEPATFPLDGVIAGWTEGLQLMQEGGKYRFFIPPHLAYGSNPPTPSIPPNAILTFEVDLLDVQGDGGAVVLE